METIEELSRMNLCWLDSYRVINQRAESKIKKERQDLESQLSKQGLSSGEEKILNDKLSTSKICMNLTREKLRRVNIVIDERNSS